MCFKLKLLLSFIASNWIPLWKNDWINIDGNNLEYPSDRPFLSLFRIIQGLNKIFIFVFQNESNNNFTNTRNPSKKWALHILKILDSFFSTNPRESEKDLKNWLRIYLSWAFSNFFSWSMGKFRANC